MNKKQSKNKTPSGASKTKGLKAASNNKRALKKLIRQRRPTHKRLMLHPVAIFLWLCIGVLIVGWTYRVIAASYTVTATVPAPPLEKGATITYPASGQAFSNQTLTVQGSCPQNSYVNLYDNSLFIGVAWCSSASTFSVQLDLFSGQNVFTAEAFNITNAQGPTTPAVSVTYTPPNNTSPVKSSSVSSVEASATSTTTATSTPTLPLLLEGNFSFQTFVAGNAFSWTISLNGGQPPYKLTISWGDGQKSTETFPSDPTFTITHTYSKPGYYPVVVHSVDKVGNQSTLQLAALIESPGAQGFTASPPPPPPTSPKSNNNSSVDHIVLSVKDSWLILAWPIYIILALMLVSFWLGERREYSALLQRKRPKRRHA